MIRVAVTGPESTGKTFLAEKLSAHFNCPLVEEYARVYLEKLNRPYTYEDVGQIAIAQMKQEDDIILSRPDLLIADTELLVVKIWMEYKYGKTPDWLETKIMERQYDLYLLCVPDIPWIYDPLREHPGLGDYFYQWFRKELSSRKFNFTEISGKEQERTDKAIRAVKSLISLEKP